MTQQEFMDTLLDILQRDEAITMDMPLKNIEEWDSLSIMAVIAWAHKHHDKTLTFDSFKDTHIVADIATLALGSLDD